MSHLDIKALRQDRVQRETAVSKSETGASVLPVSAARLGLIWGSHRFRDGSLRSAGVRTLDFTKFKYVA
jgi:hypothetical protein